MDSIPHSSHGISLHDSPPVPVDLKRTFENFFSQSVDLVGECPRTDEHTKGIPNRFFLYVKAPCRMDSRCLSLIRKIHKIEKANMLHHQGEFLFRSFVIEVVGLIEGRIETIKKNFSIIPNFNGKLAFSHYLAAIVLLYGLASGVIDDLNSYEHHRNEARSRNEYCTRILSLPAVFPSSGSVDSTLSATTRK